LLSLDLEPETMDAITAISVVEHAGLENEAGYGQAAEGETDRVLLERLQFLLRPGGLLILTVPFGRAGNGVGYRVYDSTSLAALTKRWEIQETLYLHREGDEHWLPCEAESLAEVDSASDSTQHPFPISGVALVALRKP
jgi:hypothetical protein